MATEPPGGRSRHIKKERKQNTESTQDNQRSQRDSSEGDLLVRPSTIQEKEGTKEQRTGEEARERQTKSAAKNAQYEQEKEQRAQAALRASQQKSDGGATQSASAQMEKDKSARPLSGSAETTTEIEPANSAPRPGAEEKSGLTLVEQKKKLKALTAEEMEVVKPRAKPASSDVRWRLPSEIKDDINAACKPFLQHPLHLQTWDSSGFEALPEAIMDIWIKTHPDLFDEQLRDPCLWPRVAMNDRVITGGEVILTLRAIIDDLKSRSAGGLDLEDTVRNLHAQINTLCNNNGSVHEEALAHLGQTMGDDMRHWAELIVGAVQRMEQMLLYEKESKEAIQQWRMYMEYLVVQIEQVHALCRERLHTIPEEQKVILRDATIKHQKDLAETMRSDAGIRMTVEKEVQAAIKAEVDRSVTHRTDFEKRLRDNEKFEDKTREWADTVANNLNGLLARSDDAAARIQLLEEQNASLRQENASQRQDITALMARLESMESRVADLEAGYEEYE